MELFTEQIGVPQQTPSQTKLIMLGEALKNSIREFHYDTDLVGFEDIFNVNFWEQTWLEG